MALAAVAALLAGCAALAPTGPSAAEVLAPQERHCLAAGWQHRRVTVAGIERRLLWKGPAGPWLRGAIVVLHGGGGSHFQFCLANARLTEPQVEFTTQAVAAGFAVFLLDSSDRVSDNAGRACGKVWDDELRTRANLDLPFIGEVLRSLIPAARPPGSRPQIFMTGLSSGGYMTARAATHFDDLVTAFAPVSSGDPYGWHRRCIPGLTTRTTVHGAAFDNETGLMISTPGACSATGAETERRWDSTGAAVKPVFSLFHHRHDGIHDQSCAQKLQRGLRARGYPEQPAFVPEGDGRRSALHHFWLSTYNRPLLEFFSEQAGGR